MTTTIGRRTFLKMAGVATPAVAAFSCADREEAARSSDAPVDRASVKWDKAPCRFCGTGCGVMVATKNGRVVATHGDLFARRT
jgi:nitrate reductase NapA